MVMDQLADGGAQKVASVLSLAMSENLRRTILLFRNQVVYAYSGKLVALDSAVRGNPFTKLRELVRKLIFLKRMVEKEEPRAVLSFQEGANYVNILTKLLFSSRAKPYKCVITVHTTLSRVLSRRNCLHLVHMLFIRLLYNRADHIIAVSEGVREDLNANFKIRADILKTIHNPINFDTIRRLSLETADHPWFSDSIPVIATLGRLTAAKGQDRLLKAFARVKLTLPECRLVLIGDGELKEELRKLARDLGLEKDVLFLGFQANPFKYLSRASIFVFPSIWEGFPVALLEAMACGCPVIASDCKSGPREILSPGGLEPTKPGNITMGPYGVLVPTGEIEPLERAILTLLTDAALRNHYSEMAVARAHNFDARNIAKAYERLLFA
jgi:glycosyltransferase involved in cell wall biosynthesis